MEPVVTFEDIATKVKNEVANPILVNKTEEELINDFLDKINEIKSVLSEKTEILNNIARLLTKITWLDANTDEEENIIKDIISTSKDLHYRIIREYAYVNRELHKTGTFKSELRSFKNAIDEIKEGFEDLEMIFFDLRKDEDFNKLIDSIND